MKTASSIAAAALLAVAFGQNASAAAIVDTGAPQSGISLGQV